MNSSHSDELRYFFVQSNADSGYFLFPHQGFGHDSLRLPPFCQCNGHPTLLYEEWNALSEHPETFKTGDLVVLYQAGNPNWLRGFWGYGVIRKAGDVIAIRTKALLGSPLVLNDATRKRFTKKFLKGLVRTRKPEPYRRTYAELSAEDFTALKDAIDLQRATRPRGAHEREVPEIRSTKASDAFKKWAKKKGWEVLAAGYPDLLAELPNRRIAAFEAKLSDKLRPVQVKMFRILERQGLRISVLRHTPNSVAADQIRKHHWKVIAVDIGTNTKGWPDFILKKGRRVVAVELKTGWAELVSEMQMATLSALASELGLEVHIVRAIKWHGEDAWYLYDDTERWLLYPPK